MLAAVIVHALSTASGRSTVKDSPGTVMDEHSMEETRVHVEKMGKWRSQALTISKSVRFHFVVRCVSRVHAQIDHFMNYVKSTKHDHGTFLHFCWEGTTQFIGEFNKLTTRVAWADLLEEAKALELDAGLFSGLVHPLSVLSISNFRTPSQAIVDCRQY